jgi:hypothetical protein
MSFHRLIAIALIGLIPFSGFATPHKKRKPKKKEKPKQEVTVEAHPLQFVIRGQRVDIGLRVKETNQWVFFCPQVYLGNIIKRENSVATGEKDKVSGFGLNIEHKFILDDDPDFFSTYVTYGAGFQHFSIGYSGTIWDSVINDGLTYYKQRDLPQKERINRFSAMGAAGVLVPLTDHFYGDVYIGVGLRNSWATATSAAFPDYSGFMNYAFTGVHPVAGVKIGVKF